MNPGPDQDAFAEIVAAARNQASGGSVVIAFANSRYIDVLMNWLVALALNGVDNYLIVALDRELHQFLNERGIPVVLSELSGDLSALWMRRIDVFTALCAAGVDFVHSDVDAIWIRDPRAAYLSDPQADLIISQGTIWPPDSYQTWGFVLCCGFFQLRSTVRTRRLLGELKEHVQSTGDDQVSLNQLIAGRSTRWQIEPADAYYVDASPARFLCARSVMRGLGSDGLRVQVLPHHLFQRVPLASGETPYVLHLLTRKEPGAKLLEFEKFGCLWLRADWRRIDFAADSIARLRRDR
jgi:hypothetical protein